MFVGLIAALPVADQYLGLVVPPHVGVQVLLCLEHLATLVTVELLLPAPLLLPGPARPPPVAAAVAVGAEEGGQLLKGIVHADGGGG